MNKMEKSAALQPCTQTVPVRGRQRHRWSVGRSKQRGVIHQPLTHCFIVYLDEQNQVEPWIFSIKGLFIYPRDRAAEIKRQ